MSEVEVEDKPQQDVIMPGALAGTPEKVYVSQLCLRGRHEGFVQAHVCKGALVWWGKTNYCRCACHCYIRDVAPGTDFEPPPRPERDPLKPTLAEELRAWGRSHDLAVPLSVKAKEQVTDTAVTAEGRRARGALELQVLRIAQMYESGDVIFDDDELPYLTPQTISELIADTYNVSAPSTGAIRNVLVRWAGSQFAIVKENPFRFVAVTPMGHELGHERLAERMKK